MAIDADMTILSIDCLVVPFFIAFLLLRLKWWRRVLSGILDLRLVSGGAGKIGVFASKYSSSIESEGEQFLQLMPRVGKLREICGRIDILGFRIDSLRSNSYDSPYGSISFSYEC